MDCLKIVLIYQITAIHVNASEFNSLIDDPNTLLVDMRNHYESEIGHFEGSNFT